MDVMELRRRMMALMANGAEVIKGSFTVENDGSVYKRVQFPKTINKYLYYVEMDENSKEALMQTGINGNKAYACFGIYPMIDIEDVTQPFVSSAFRINPSTKTPGVISTSDYVKNIDNTGFEIQQGTYSSGVYYVYYGSTYNYVIVSLDDI